MDKVSDISAIDIFAHVLPGRYREILEKRTQSINFYMKMNEQVRELSDIEARFRIMDMHPGMRQVLTLASPPLEEVITDAKSVRDLSKMANDQMAELVAKYPDRFVAAVASVPMVDIDEALSEIDRVIIDLNFKGIQIYTPCNGKALDSPEFMPLYEKMSEYDLPIWIHPARDRAIPDYEGESHSRYGLFMLVGWPYETTLAMCRLVFGGVLEKQRKIRFVAHHCGAMVPFFAPRITAQRRPWLPDNTIKYFRMFYCDTATVPSLPSLACTLAFFGSDHMMFGTDMPYASSAVIAQTLSTIDSLEIADREKKRVLKDNAITLMRLEA